MEIVVRLDVMLALRKMKARELAAEIGITEQNLSLCAPAR
jgi:putative transcriptional regulator